MATRSSTGCTACEVLRDYYGELCELVAASSETLNSCVINLYSERMVDMTTKNVVIETKGYGGANIILDHLMMKVKAKPQRFHTILEIMMKEEALRDIAEKMKEGFEGAKPVSAWTVPMVPISANCELHSMCQKGLTTLINHV